MAKQEPKGKRELSYKDYCSWPENERWEIIDGEAFDMTPAPGTTHQTISMNLSGLLWEFFRGKPCKVFAAPFDVRLPKDGEPDGYVKDVVQPDIAVICDEEKIDEKGCRGAPDFIIEIISPSTASKDHIKKRRLYEKHGVREYWLVHPEDRLITVYRPGKPGSFAPPEIFGEDENIAVSIFPGLEIDFNRVFPMRHIVVRESPGIYSP